MTEQYQIWFDELVKIRAYLADALELSAATGVQDTFVEQFSDEAHFIYELLQNADDAGAKIAKFNLTDKGLFFTHNGTTKFTISQPDTLEDKEIEKRDKNNGKLGHVNSICSIGNSSKKIESNSIGKFGVGFKAVFEYTETPHIYDPNFQFRIDRFIVPVKLDNDLANREKNETVFYFPFNNAEMSAEKAHLDILEKLKKLVYPTLFLSNLEKVEWNTDDVKGEYTKKIIERKQAEEIAYEKIELYQQIGLNQTKENLYLFTRSTNENHTYSIGYFLDEQDKLISKQLPAFCFFPVIKENTNLNFILHAPFLLTKSRETIKNGKDYNKELVDLLSQLAADSLLILRDLKLIDDDIINIIPYKNIDYGDDGFFDDFYFAIEEKLKAEELLPAKKGYAVKENAYWAQDNPVLNLFSDEQLAYLSENKNAKWVFRSFVRNKVGNDEDLRNYLDNCIENWYDMSDMLEMIDENFIENQSNDWLKKLYEYLAKNNSYWESVNTKPIFLNSEGRPVPAYDEYENLVLFFPDNDNDGYETINSELFNAVGKKPFEKFGIREHTVSDEIENAIIQVKEEKLDYEIFFSKAFKYFKSECPQDEIEEFIEKIKDISFIPCYSEEEGDEFVTYGGDCYYPTEKLVEFYKSKPNTWFANVKKLQKKYSEEEYKTLDKFLKLLGVNDEDPDLRDAVYNIAIPKLEEDGDIDTMPLFKTLFQYYRECKNEDIDEFIEDIEDLEFIHFSTNEDDEVYRGSANEIYFPNEELREYFKTKPSTKFLLLEEYHEIYKSEKEQQKLKEFFFKLGIAELPRIERKEFNEGYWNRKYKTLIEHCYANLEDTFKQQDNKKSLLLWSILGKMDLTLKLEEKGSLEDLKNTKWLVNINNEFVKPNQININELSDEYEINSYQAKQLIDLLEFKPLIELTEEEKRLQTYDQLFESENEALEAKKALEEKRERENEIRNRNSLKTSYNSTSDYGSENGSDIEKESSTIERSIKTLADLQQKLIPVKQHTRSTPQQGVNNSNAKNSFEDFDESEELTKGIEGLKKQLEIKKSRIDLAESINNNVKYSYDWFKAYLKLLATYGEKQDNQKRKSISFQEIKPFKDDNKYFLLCGASSYISPEIENADDFKISLVFGSGKRENITVEGVSKKGQDLLVYCREPMSGNTLSRLSNIFKVEINFTPVIDLLDRLQRAFENRNYIDEWENIEEAMPSLNYIYGPPGTGKTTTLCNNINEILATNPNAKFLVLTPTNKASDVVCEKLWEINDDIYSVRLSSPTDPDLELLGEKIYRNSLESEDMEVVNVVASTIHRLPYFDIQEIGLLFQYEWDYVIFDESSMTGLHYITFAIMALFKTNPNTNFIIAGDPKQIPPVVEIDEKELENFDFQDENIYKMMNLESFKPSEQTIRENDTIQNLDTQYRSIPQIGQLFSELSYSSLLNHDRATNREETKQLPEKFRNLISSNVTFVDIPLNQDNSICRVNKLFYSSYHTYCAILVSEIIKYFDSTNKSGQWTIGLIAPYKAQAMLLNKLITSYGISENVKVISDTVHGFQGDECDIVFFVCNPNNYKYTGDEKALLSKEYIYNVAISRAKDYLVILYPYEAIQNNTFINKIGHSYKNNFGNTKILNTKEIERTLFNDENYIENNSYVSGHDNVNVFGLSEMKYFIKANDTAIDIQLRDIHNQNSDRIESPKLAGVKVLGKIDLNEIERYKKKK